MPSFPFVDLRVLLVVDAFFFAVVTSDLAADLNPIEDHRCMATSAIRRSSPNEVSHAIITAAMRVHTERGPGLPGKHLLHGLVFSINYMSAAYDQRRRLVLPVVYHGVKLELGYRMDLLVEELVVVEIKSVDAVSPVHQAQLLSYLKLSGKSIGLLINFNVVHLKDGIKRFVNGTEWK